jgi:hypothetical protein
VVSGFVELLVTVEHGIVIVCEFFVAGASMKWLFCCPILLLHTKIHTTPNSIFDPPT